MLSARLFRLSKVSLLLGCLLAALSVVSKAVLFPGLDLSAGTQPLWIPLSLLYFVGIPAVLLGLPGVYAPQAAQLKTLGLIGFVLIFFWGVVCLALSTIDVFVIPFVAAHASVLGNDSSAGGVLVLLLVVTLLGLVGFPLLGIATMRANVLPRWTSLLFIITPFISFLAFVPLPGLIGGIIGSGYTSLLLIGLLRFAYTHSSTPQAEPEQQVRAART
jgi:hypothetical protein